MSADNSTACKINSTLLRKVNKALPCLPLAHVSLFIFGFCISSFLWSPSTSTILTALDFWLNLPFLQICSGLPLRIFFPTFCSSTLSIGFLKQAEGIRLCRPPCTCTYHHGTTVIYLLLVSLVGHKTLKDRSYVS